MRQIVKREDLNTNVIAIYDICREDRSKYPTLTRAGNSELEDDIKFLPNYIHVGAEPRKKIDADSKLAESIIETCNSNTDENGVIRFPDVFNNLTGYVTTSQGGSYKINWKEGTAKK